MATWGFASPRLLGPTDRKQSAPGAAGKRLLSGVSASAEDSEAAVVPEPEVCASRGKGVRGTLAWGLQTAWQESAKKPDGNLPRLLPVARGTGRGLRARQLWDGQGKTESQIGLSAPSKSPPSPVSFATPDSPPPSAGFVLFRGPGISRRVLGFFSGGGGSGRASRGPAGTCSSAGRGRKCWGSFAVVAGWHSV